MTQQSGYNGWTNYETWVTALWIDNEEGTYLMVRSIARDVFENNEWTPLVQLADALKDLVEEWVVDEDQPASLATDLLLSAFGEIDFYEIAGTLLDEIRAECPWTDADECATAEERRVAATDTPAAVCPVHGGAA